jgi:hypothetical protein
VIQTHAATCEGCYRDEEVKTMAGKFKSPAKSSPAKSSPSSRPSRILSTAL